MKIAPYTKGWNNGERDWSFVEDPRASIEAWEERESLSLPIGYRNFLLEYNGGRVYPRLFQHAVGSLVAGPYVDESAVTYVELIYPWSVVEGHWRGETYGEGVPPNHLVVAGTPGEIELLMSLESDSYAR
ncbi:SMI1/KNR4 family protein [bacterium]|nr:SMI1/KNR4 family protein [bacterium]